MYHIIEEFNYKLPVCHKHHSEKESTHAAKHEAFSLASQAVGKALLTLGIAIQIFAATLKYFS